MEYNMMPPPSSALSDLSSGFGDGNLSSGSSCGSTDHKHVSSGYASQKSLESITEEDTKPPSGFLQSTAPHKPVVLAGRAHVNRPPPLNLHHTGTFFNETIQTSNSYQYQTENSPHILQNQHLAHLSGHNAIPQSTHHRILQNPQITQNICHSPSHHPYQEHISSPHPQSATPHASARYTFNERQMVSSSLPGTPFGDARINSPLHRVQNMHHYNSAPRSPLYNANQFDPNPSPHHFIDNKQQALQSGYNDPHPSPLPYNQKNSPHSYTEPAPSPAAHYTETKPSPHHYSNESQQIHGMHQSGYTDVVNKMDYRNPVYDPGTPYTNPSHPGTPAYADSPHHSSPHPQTYQHFFGPDYAHRMLIGPDIKPNITQDGQYPPSSSANQTDNDGLLHDGTAAANTLLSAINMKQEHDPLSITQESHGGIISNQVMETDWNHARIKQSPNQQALPSYMFDGSAPTDVDELLTQATEFMNSTSMSLSSDGSSRSDAGKAARSRTKGRPSKNSMSPRSFGAQCPVCGKSFNNSSALAKHKLTHSDERKYVCTVCSKAFKRQDHLNGHMMTHRSKKPFECSFDGCMKSYCDARSLRRHLENHHNVPSDSLYDMSLNNFGANGSFNSPTGGNNYQQPSENQSPSRVSPGSYPPGSNQLFRYDSQTSNPSRDGAKPAECSVCGKKFKNLPALNGHMRLHGGYVNVRKPDQPATSDRSQSLKSPADSLSSISSASQLVSASPREPALSRKHHIHEVMDKDSLNPHTYNENQGNVRQGGDGAGMGHTFGPAVLPYGGFPSPGAAAAALIAQSSSVPLAPQNNNDFFNQRERMVQEIMQMQHRMPYIPIGGTQLYPSLLDNIGDRPDPLQNLAQLASLPNQLRMPVSYMNDPAVMARTMVSQPQMSHHQPRPAMVSNQPPATDPLPMRPQRPGPAPTAVQQPAPTDSTTQQADMEVSEINNPNKEQESETTEFQAQRKRHASAPDTLFMVTDQQQATLKDQHHSYAAVDRNRRRRLSADAYSDHDHMMSRHRHRTADQPLAHSDGATLFRSPQPVPHGLAKKRKARPEPLVIHPNVAATQSRLRSPRIWEGSLTSSYPSDRIGRTGKTPPPYTPPPILSPLRTGTGLFYGSHRPSHTPLSASLPAAHFNSLRSQPTIPETEEPQFEEKPPTVSPPAEVIPPPIETDIQPHINIGPNHQAVLPQLRKSLNEAFQTDEHAQLLWAPSALDTRFSNDELDAYMEFACSAAVPGSGSNKEYALHQLFFNKGDLMKSVLCMMERSVKPQFAKFIKDYHYQDSDVWTTEDIENYTDAIMKSDKDFHSIASTFQGRKSHKQCIEFYYLWKKICPEEYKRLRLLRRKKRMEDYNLRSRDRNGNEPAEEDIHPADEASDIESNVSEESEDDTHSIQSSAPSRASVQSAPVRPRAVSSPAWLCEYPGCNAVFTTKQALTGHARIHGPIRPFSNPNRSRDASPSPMRKPKVKAEPMPIGSEEFPCKLCGKVFYKVKSRSAHMKSHSVLAKKSKEQKAAQQQLHH